MQHCLVTVARRHVLSWLDLNDRFTRREKRMKLYAKRCMRLRRSIRCGWLIVRLASDKHSYYLMIGNVPFCRWTSALGPHNWNAGQSQLAVCPWARPVQLGEAVGITEWPCVSVPHWWPSQCCRHPQQTMAEVSEFIAAGSAENTLLRLSVTEVSVRLDLTCGTVCCVTVMSPTVKLLKLSANVWNISCLAYHLLDTNCFHFRRVIPFSILVLPKWTSKFFFN